MKTKPKIFISYSWSSPEYEKKVISLAEKLTEDGILVILDKWDLKEGQDKYVFMEQMVIDESVTKVLILCDEAYADKTDKRKGGVGTESQIISKEVYNKVNQEKFIPIVMEVDGKGNPFLPTYLKSRIHINLSSHQQFYSEYEKLVRNIYGKPLYERPKVGTPPSYLKTNSTVSTKTNNRLFAFKYALQEQKQNTPALCADYLETFLSVFDNFYIEPDDKKEFDEQIIENIRSFKRYRDEFIEFIHAIITNLQGKNYHDDLFNFFEKILRFKFPPDNVNGYQSIWCDNHRFIIRELFLYLISLLIKYRKYDIANFFLSEKYFYKTNTLLMSSYYGCFDSYLRSIDEHRKKRLKLNRTSITADIIKERCDSKYISFEELIQADIILAIRGFISKTTDSVRWYPRTLVYADRFERKGLDIFFRAQTKRNFEVIKILLDINSKGDLFERYNKVKDIYKLEAFSAGGVWPISFSSLLNLNNLYEEK